jgi:hypothetical protein
LTLITDNNCSATNPRLISFLLRSSPPPDDSAPDMMAFTARAEPPATTEPDLLAFTAPKLDVESLVAPEGGVPDDDPPTEVRGRV